MISAKELRDAFKRDALALRLNNEARVTGVGSLAEASGIWCELREASGCGSSAMPKVTIVDVDTGKVLAHVSYNGKVWLGERWTPKMLPIYDPCAKEPNAVDLALLVPALALAGGAR